MHDDPLPQCEKLQCAMQDQITEHIRESGPVREDVAKSKERIVTLTTTQEQIMADIKGIHEEVAEINVSIKDMQASVKIWVLSGIVGTIMAFSIPTMMLFYNAGRMQMQLDINTERWNKVMDHEVAR